MALTFPLSRAQFFDLLPVSMIRMELPEQVSLARTGAGEQLTSDLGERIWQGEVMLGRMKPSEAGHIEVLIDLLRAPGRSFHAFDTRRAWPLSDPGGAILGAAVPRLRLVPGSLRDIRLDDLPEGYRLDPGDYLSFAYGTSPERRALHRVVEPAVSQGGSTDAFEITPGLRPGASTGAVVALASPFMKAVLIPGSIDTGTARRFLVEGASFQFVQTLR